VIFYCSSVQKNKKGKDETRNKKNGKNARVSLLKQREKEREIKMNFEYAIFTLRMLHSYV